MSSVVVPLKICKSILVFVLARNTVKFDSIPLRVLLTTLKVIFLLKVPAKNRSITGTTPSVPFTQYVMLCRPGITTVYAVGDGRTIIVPLGKVMLTSTGTPFAVPLSDTFCPTIGSYGLVVALIIGTPPITVIFATCVTLLLPALSFIVMLS